MKKILRLAAAALAGIMISSTAVFADETAPVFKDVDPSTDTGKAIMKMYDAGMLAGYEDGTFRPDGSITRAELVRVFNQVFKYTADENDTVEDFLDNTDKEAWYYNDVKIAQVNGYINGFEDNTFRPKENFTRQQVCVVMDLITDLELPEYAVEISDPVSEWAAEYVNRALVAGFFTLEEGNTFRATQNITRGEVCELLAIFVSEKSEDTEETTLAEGETEVITAKTSNGTVVSVPAGGGGGGGRGNNNTNTTTATGTTSENVTKDDNKVTTVTESASETTTASKNNNKATTETASTKTTSDAKTTTTTKSTTKPTTEATTETTTETTKVTTEATTEGTSAIVPDNNPGPDVVSALNRVYKNITKYVVPKCTSDAQKDVAKGISDAIFKYLGDYSYDFSGRAAEVIDQYRQLPEDEKDQLKKLLISSNSVADLVILQEHYFPGLM